MGMLIGLRTGPLRGFRLDRLPSRYGTVNWLLTGPLLADWTAYGTFFGMLIGSPTGPVREYRLGRLQDLHGDVDWIANGPLREC